MKKSLYALLALTLSLPTFAATAPDSLAGKVYRDTWFFTTIRQTGERTILFGSNGRFTFLKYALGSPLNLEMPRVVFFRDASDGTYSYQRTGDATATVELHYDTGSSETLPWTFTAPNGSNGPEMTFAFSDLRDPASFPATNISMRGRVSEGRPLTVGFVVPGPQSPPSSSFVPTLSALQNQREVLLRVVGPSLSRFGVTDVWADPDFKLYRGSVPAVVDEVHNGDWPATGIGKIFSYVGAFPLQAGSKDAADVVRLDPGDYTIVCNPSAGDPGGEALIEVYFLP